MSKIVLVPFYNEHAIATRMQHKTSHNRRNQSEYTVAKFEVVASYLSSLLSLSPRQNWTSKNSYRQHARLQVHCRTFFCLQFIFATFYTRVLLLCVHCRRGLRKIGTYTFLENGWKKNYVDETWLPSTFLTRCLLLWSMSDPELNYKTWNSHCTFTQCKSKRASVLKRERNKFGYS